MREVFYFSDIWQCYKLIMKKEAKTIRHSVNVLIIQVLKVLRKGRGGFNIKIKKLLLCVWFPEVLKGQ